MDMYPEVAMYLFWGGSLGPQEALAGFVPYFLLGDLTRGPGDPPISFYESWQVRIQIWRDSLLLAPLNQ